MTEAGRLSHGAIFLSMKPTAMHLTSLRRSLLIFLSLFTSSLERCAIAQENDAAKPPSAELLQPLIEKRDALRVERRQLCPLPRVRELEHSRQRGRELLVAGEDLVQHGRHGGGGAQAEQPRHFL